jgi:signal transduction histidine kinase
MTQEIVLAMQSSMLDEEQTLLQIAEGVVSELGYVAAMVATYEPDDSLTVRAFHIDPAIVAPEQVELWGTEVSRYAGRSLSITDPQVARVYVHQEEYHDNLSVRAYAAGGPVASGDLYDLLRPVAPPAAKPVIEGIQQMLEIQTVIAVPFFLDPLANDSSQQEIVGNLFAATRSRRFGAGEIELLQAFGQQAAAGIRNARLYHEAEERREVAQVFGNMAFSAAAFVHALRNHLGAVRTHLHLIKIAPKDKLDEILSLGEKAIEILAHLHEPWRETPDVPTDVNDCLKLGVESSLRDRERIEEQGIHVELSLAEDLPPVKTSHDMLSEAFRILVSNGLEAILGKGEGGELRVVSRRGADSCVEVAISDSGVGIRPENLGRIFELRWTARIETGMGFGLFWTKEYVDGLGGSIEVESDLNQGTTMIVRFPPFD